MIQGDQKMTDLKTASHQTHLKLKDGGDSKEGGGNCHSQGPHKNNEVPWKMPLNGFLKIIDHLLFGYIIRTTSMDSFDLN